MSAVTHHHSAKTAQCKQSNPKQSAWLNATRMVPGTNRTYIQLKQSCGSPTDAAGLLQAS